MQSNREPLALPYDVLVNWCIAVLAKLPKKGTVYGIPRGGTAAALLLVAVSKGKWAIVDRPEAADLIFDDILATGKTMERALRPRQGGARAVLVCKNETDAQRLGVQWGAFVSPDQWVVFPWEGSLAISSEDIGSRLLEYIGEDPKREGLSETPARFARAWHDWTDGYTRSPADVLKVFEDGAESYDEMLVQRDIPLYSHCEHHLAPFFGVAHIAYMPRGKIVGLSKIARLVDIFAHRLQVQERLTAQIADAMQKHLEPRGVAVVLECRHLCMESRGIRKQGTVTTTSAMRGMLRDVPAVRAEFFSLLRKS